MSVIPVLSRILYHEFGIQSPVVCVLKALLFKIKILTVFQQNNFWKEYDSVYLSGEKYTGVVKHKCRVCERVKSKKNINRQQKKNVIFAVRINLTLAVLAKVPRGRTMLSPRFDDCRSPLNVNIYHYRTSVVTNGATRIYFRKVLFAL